MKQFVIPVGLPIQFYINGDKAHPVAGQVSVSGEGMRVKVNLFMSSGGEFVRTREFVRFHDDPWLKDHPETIRGAKHGVPSGTWGFVPGMELNLEEVEEVEVVKAKPSEKSKRTEGLARAKDFIEGGMEAKAAFNKVKSFGISAEEVEKMYQEYALANA